MDVGWDPVITPEAAKIYMNLTEYRQFVRSLASKRDGEPIYNASVEHASVVVESLFANADSQVDVLSGVFNARVYGRDPVIEEAKLFLGSSAKNRLRIILEEDSPEDRTIHPFFKACSELPNIELRIVPQDLQELYGFHFVLVDDDSYRFESDKTKPSAVAAFGHKEGAANLASIYQDLWDQCEAVDIIPEQV